VARPKSELVDRTSARTVRVLRWLRRKPLPAKIVGATADDDEVTCAVSGGTTNELHDVVSVVRDCVVLTALDDKGNQLRRLRLDNGTDPELRAEAEVEAAVRSGGQNSVPIISVDVPKLVDSIARNIREAVSEATRNNSQAHRGGFDAMVAVMNIALNLLVGIEQRYANAEQALAERLNAQPAGGSDPNDPDGQKRQMAMLALQKVMGGSPGNGAGGFDPAKLMAFMQQMQGGGAEGNDDAS